MTKLESKILIGTVSYRVFECLRNMKGAFNKDEALRWGFCIQKAFLEFGYNPEIDSTMNQILVSKEVPSIVVEAEIPSDVDSSMPSTFINKIFKTEFNQEQLKHLCHWIKEYLIDNIRYPYQYLSLILFLEYHHSSFLQESHITNTDMEDQMKTWYPNVKIQCTADSLGTYRNGFFDKNTFSFVSWLNSNGEPPVGYEYKRDQTLSGFQSLSKLCNNMELNLSELKI